MRRKRRKGLLGFVAVLAVGLAVVAMIIFGKGPAFQEEKMIDFITALYTVGFEESEELFKELEKEIEAALNNNDQAIVTFNSGAIEEAVENKFGHYLTQKALNKLLNEGVLTSLYQLSYDSRSDFKVAHINKLDEKKEKGRIEVSYAVDIEQTNIASYAENTWSTEVTVYIVKGKEEWEISRVKLANTDYLKQ